MTTMTKTTTPCPRFSPPTSRRPFARRDDRCRIEIWHNTHRSPRPCSSLEQPSLELPEAVSPRLHSQRVRKLPRVERKPPLPTTMTTRKIFTANHANVRRLSLDRGLISLVL